MIRFESVTKKYPDGTVAVDGLDLIAPSGQITVFVGPSGCGKTTSLRMINRMIDITSGTIWLDDQDTAKVDAATLRRGIGYVIQHAGLFPHRTVVDNVATVPFLLGWDKKKARARATELLERVGLPASFAKRYPAQLSGGQQQRVGVARALAADPPVMLMDEPFSAVDPVVRTELQDEFLRLQSELGKTIIFVTHDIDEAVKLGDQVAVLKVGGTLGQLAPPSVLLTDPVDDFVAGFVGRDRGYRALSFEQAGSVPVHDEKTVKYGAGAAEVNAAAVDDWALAVDDGGKPLGWVHTRAVSGGRTLGPTQLHRGGTVAPTSGTLRNMLDAALSSPSSRGVLVDDDGRLVGTTTASEVVAKIETQLAERRTADLTASAPGGAGAAPPEAQA